MKRILSYTKNHKLLTFLGTISMIIVIAAELINPYLIKVFTDDIIMNGKYQLLSTILLGIVGITVTKFIFGYLKEFLFDFLASKVARELKQTIFDHIQGLSFSYFDDMNTGELMSRVGEDVDNIWMVLGFGLRLFIENIVYFVLASFLLIRINLLLTIVALITMPVIALVTIKLEKQLDNVFEKISDHTAKLNTTAQENIAGVKLVKAFAREKHEILKFLKFNNKNFDLNMERAKVWGKFYPIEEFLGNVSIVLVTCFGGILVIKGSMTVGTLLAFINYLWLLIWPSKISEIQGEITFEDVFFRYKEKPVLKNVDLDIKAGSTVAIMGTTGSGKSSLISLLNRNYDIFKGTLKVDGVDIKHIDLNTLRRSVSIVPQDSFLFSDTIENNIRYGRPDATLEEIKKACATACASEFINELEEGYDTLIGERGVGLSGGQKQRLCIARALIRDCSILILDDSTSALDMETEYELLNNLYHSDKKVTTFIIAHRISAVKNADVIIYMEDGRIVEIGNHNTLLEKQGKYYDIYRTQFKDFLSLGDEEVS